jgi:hypothetical protein
VGGWKEFVDSPEELEGLRERIKQACCPRCGRAGTLNCHGRVYGNASAGDAQVLRGARFYCSARRQGRPGCGRAVMVWLACRLPGYSVGTAALWRFLALLGRAGLSVAAAWETARTGFSLESARRWARRWRYLQGRLRALLCRVRDPPPGGQKGNPLAQTTLHLALALGAEDPLKGFQARFQTSPMRTICSREIPCQSRS